VKKIFLVLVLSVLFISVVLSNTFKDVPINHWAYEAVQRIASIGIVEGYPDGTFKGMDQINRYQITLTISRTIDYMESAMISPLTTKLSEVEKNLNSISTQISAGASSTQITELRNSLNTFSNKMTTVENTIYELRNSYELLGYATSKIDELQRRLDQMETLVIDIDNKMNQLSITTPGADAVLSLNEKIEELKTSLNATVSSSESLKKSIENLSLKQDTLTKRFDESNLKINDLSTNFNNLNATVLDLSRSYVTLNNKVDSLISENAANVTITKFNELNEKVNTLNSAVEENLTNLSSLRVRVNNLERLSTNNQSDIEKMGILINQLNTKIDSTITKSELNEIRAKLNAVEDNTNDIINNRRDISKIQSDFDVIQNSVNALSNQLEETNTKINQIPTTEVQKKGGISWETVLVSLVLNGVVFGTVYFFLQQQ